MLRLGNWWSRSGWRERRTDSQTSTRADGSGASRSRGSHCLVSRISERREAERVAQRACVSSLDGSLPLRDYTIHSIYHEYSTHVVLGGGGSFLSVCRSVFVLSDSQLLLLLVLLVLLLLLLLLVLCLRVFHVGSSPAHEAHETWPPGRC